MPGIDGTAADDGARAVRIDLVEDGALLPGAASGERLAQAADADGRVAATIDAADGGGFSLWADGFGTAWIRSDGGEVLCAPATGPAWRWQRFLVGRVLPWAALLRGREIFHASAVRIAGKTVAFVGPSGTGKTSLALQLMLRGGSFVTDDVLALEPAAGRVLAHPGASICAVRAAERATLTRRDERALGTLLGTSDKSYIAVEREHGAHPLDALYFLRSGHGLPLVEPVSQLDPRLLLSSTFVVSVQSPQRLRNHLEVCGELARSVPIFHLTVDPELGSSALADTLIEQLRR